MKTFLIEQKITPLANQYRVYAADDQGVKTALVAFAHQKRFAFKEKFTLYSDEGKQSAAFEVEARQVLDFGARYDVRDASGKVLGVVGKAFGASFLRSTWHIYEAGKEESPLVIVQERDATLAVIRRIWGMLPILGEIPFFVKYHFDFTEASSGKVIARHNKTTLLRDNYRLEIEDEAPVDWRVMVALGVMMDAMQSR